MTMLDAYYVVKPMIPRPVQIFLRRVIARIKLVRHKAVWPIDARAARPPRGWSGWPESKMFAFVLSHDVDTIRGHENCRRLLDVERRLGFRSTFYFVPEGYAVSPELRREIKDAGFDVGVHGLRHDGKMFRSRKIFEERAAKVNQYLKDWDAVGFSSPSMHRNLAWIGDLEMAYSISTFDTDPFEPQPEGAGTIFPFRVPRQSRDGEFIEIPYTLPQDHSLFIIFRHKDNRTWKNKLDWLADKGGMALVDAHPDYMDFGGGKRGPEQYPIAYYEDFLAYVQDRYRGRYWQPLAREVAAFWAAQDFSGESSSGILSALNGARQNSRRSGLA